MMCRPPLVTDSSCVGLTGPGGAPGEERCSVMNGGSRVNRIAGTSDLFRGVPILRLRLALLGLWVQPGVLDQRAARGEPGQES